MTLTLYEVVKATAAKTSPQIINCNTQNNTCSIELCNLYNECNINTLYFIIASEDASSICSIHNTTTSQTTNRPSI